MLFVRNCSSVSVVLAALLMLGIGQAVPAQTEAEEAPQDHPAERVEETITLYAGQTFLIDAPWPIRRVAVTNPAIADVDVVSPRQVQVQALSPGVTDLTMWSEEDQIWHARVHVELDLRRLVGQLMEVLPRATLTVSQVGDIVVVSGRLGHTDQALQLRQLLEASRLNYVDLTSIGGIQQVQLRVRVAEVSRSALKALNINTFYGGNRFFGGNQLGSSAGPFTPMSVGPAEEAVMGQRVPFVVAEGGIGVPPTAQLFAGFPNSDLEFFIQALAENQYLRLLAEPTLIALSGEEARFLAGGEIPIPRAEIGPGTTSISVEYREHGIRLRFRPLVLGDGTIRLEVEPEVSELTDVGAIEILGARIPALLTRRALATLELQDGQTFALAGLLNRSINARTSRVPGLGALPVIGVLFRSVRYAQNETELVILVTAELVEPQSVPVADLPIPGMTYHPPNAWELYLGGRIEGRDPPARTPVQVERMREMGLHNLRGPGAWASYDRPTDDRRRRSGRNQ